MGDPENTSLTKITDAQTKSIAAMVPRPDEMPDVETTPNLYVEVASLVFSALMQLRFDREIDPLPVSYGEYSAQAHEISAEILAERGWDAEYKPASTMLWTGPQILITRLKKTA